jgi:hypothetical protein
MRFCRCTTKLRGWAQAPEWDWWVCAECHWPTEYAYIEGEMPPAPKHLRGVTPRTIGDLVAADRGQTLASVRGKAVTRSTIGHQTAPTSRRSPNRATSGRARASGR